MKAQDVDSALIHASERLRASMERQLDVDGAFIRLRDSIRARTTPATMVPEAGKWRTRADEEGIRQPASAGGDNVSVPTARPGPGDPNDRHGTNDSGDRSDAAIRLLYDQHAGPLLMFAQRLVGGDRQRAEEVVQETLMLAWRHAYRLTYPGRPVRPWLMAVARRIATGDLRHRDARSTTPGDPVLENFPGSPDGTDRAVADALRALRPSDRQILIETYFRGRTVAEAAAVLNLPPAAAKAQLYSALRALRTAL